MTSKTLPMTPLAVIVIMIIVAVLSSSNSFVGARHIGFWVSDDATTPVDHDLNNLKKFRAPNTQPVQHFTADAVAALKQQFAVAVDTGSETVFVHSVAHDVSKPMWYDGAPAAKKKHDDHKHDHDHDHDHAHAEHDDEISGNVANFVNVPKTATHYVRAHIPDTAATVTVFRDGFPHGRELKPTRAATKRSTAPAYTAELERSAQAQAQAHSNATVEHKTIQTADLLTQPTMVFVSSGYTAVERNRFFADVDRATNTLSGRYSSEGMDAGPWKRYFSMFNVIALYEASAQSGASFKKGPLHECPPESAGGCPEIKVQSNLDCAYGTPLPRMLGCDYQDVMTVAGYAPLAQVVVVIVNARNFGGSGGSGLAVINNGADMELTLLHSLNHAVAGLGDEFDYGVHATPHATIPNCRESNGPWAGWINDGSIPAASPAGCTFSNLHRPTADSCLMRRKVKSMCAVCAEALTQSFYALTKGVSGQALHMSSPRCPPWGYEVHVRSIDTAELTINHLFVNQGNVSVLWTLPTGVTYPSITALPVTGSQLAAGPSVVTVSMQDRSTFVKNYPADMSQTVQFHVNHVTDLSACSQISCTTSRGMTATYCARCLQAGGCAREYKGAGTAVVRPAVKTLEASDSDVSAAVATVVVIACVILFGGLIVIFVYKARNVVEVIVVRGIDVVLQWVTAFFLFAVFLISMFVVGYGVKSLPRAPVFGESALLGGLVVSAALCIISAVAMVALYARSVIGLLVPGTITCVLAIPLIIMSIFSLWVATNTFSDSVVEWMRDAWADKVADEPATICDVQNYFQCSGYEQTCAENPSTQYCSATCSYTNRYTDACLSRFESFAENDLYPAAVVAVVVSFFVICAGACVLVFAWRLRTVASNARARRSYRHDPKQPVESITDDELVALKGEFEKISTPGQGADVTEALRFLRDAFGEQVEPADESSLIAAATTEGAQERRITLERTLHIMFPYLDPGNEFHDPRTLTEDEAALQEDTTEVVRAHAMKHERYIAVAGALSPAHLRELYLEHCMPQGKYQMHPNFFGIVEAASKKYAQTVEGRMARGLTATEIDGLRSLWARLNPAIGGDLSDAAIATFFALTHNGTKIRTQEHFARWKNHLDVRGRGAIGWPEFCLPFGQRALNEDARRFMIMRTNGDLSVLQEEYGSLERMLSRREVAQDYGEAYVDYVFLPGEESVALMRVIAAVVRGDIEVQRKLQ